MNFFWNKKNFDKATFKSMVVNMGTRGLGFILSYIYIPLLLTYLGNEKYGLWATILSVCNRINMFDVGIGGGLRNILTEEIAKKKYDKARESISTAYIVLSGLSLLMWFILIFVTVFWSWDKLFNTKIEINLIMFIIYSFICINFVLSLVNVVLYALQISEQVALINLSSGIINTVGIFILSKFTVSNLLYVAIIYGLSVLFPVIINNVRIYRQWPDLRPALKAFDCSKVNMLFSLGIVFFVLQIGGLMMTATDNVLISRLYGSVEVTPVEIASKLFSVILGFYGAFIVPVWSRTTKAATERDLDWLGKMYRQLFFYLFVFSIGILLLGLSIHPICNLWLGRDIVFGNWIVVVVAIETFANMTNTSFSSMLNGLGQIKIQMYVAIFQIIVNIPLSIYFAVNFGIGILGIKIVTAVLLGFSATIYMLYVKYSINKLHSD